MADETAKCPRCSTPVKPGSLARLWDGKDYCRDCVEEAMPGLADYARAHPRLEESVRFEQLDLAKGELRLYSICFVFFGMLFTLGGYASDGLAAIPVAFALSFAITAVAALIQVPAYRWFTRGLLPCVGVENGNVTISRSGGSRACHATAPLHDWRWRIGKARHDSFLRFTMIPNRTVVILELSIANRWWNRSRLRVACGWTDETRQRWEAFFQIARVRRVGDSSRR